MANETLTGTFTNIADAIRVKSGSSSLINPLNMGNEIRDLKDLTPAATPQANLSAVFQDVADAIRECGVSGTMTPIEMPTKIGSIVVDTGDWLCFTAEEANSTVSLSAVGSAPSVSLECSTDGSTWSSFVVGTTTVTLANIGDKVYVRATSEGNTGFATSTSNYNKFVMTGKIASSGNVDTLLDQNRKANLTSFCYKSLFAGCTSLTTAPELPAKTLADNCYQSMFSGCSSLTTAPSLPSTTLATVCYEYMFQDCTSLTTAPELPALTLTNYCYSSMFRGCTSLTTAPVTLPATTLVNDCYKSMFQGCTSLTTAPALPAITMSIRCYSNMFQGCTSLTTAPALPATTLTENCYRQMFQGCSNLNTITLGYTGNFSTTYFNSWVSGVASTGTFYYYGSDTTTGTSAIPTGWTVISTTTKVKYTAASGRSDWTGDIVGELAEGDIPNVVDAEEVEIGSHVTSIGDFAFGDCCYLTSVTIPDSVTSIVEQAFSNCQSLASVTIPSSVTSIGTGAFEDCPSLMSVTFSGKTKATVQGMTHYSWSLESDCVLHCTDGDITL